MQSKLLVFYVAALLLTGCLSPTCHQDAIRSKNAAQDDPATLLADKLRNCRGEEKTKAIAEIQAKPSEVGLRALAINIADDPDEKYVPHMLVVVTGHHFWPAIPYMIERFWSLYSPYCDLASFIDVNITQFDAKVALSYLVRAASVGGAKSNNLRRLGIWSCLPLPPARCGQPEEPDALINWWRRVKDYLHVDEQGTVAVDEQALRDEQPIDFKTGLRMSQEELERYRKDSEQVERDASSWYAKWTGKAF